MQPLKFALFGLLSFNIKAFEITTYNNVGKCDANDDTIYRIISGASNGTCYTFDDAMPGTDCAQYNKGGAEGPTGCTSESLLPMSVIQENGNVACTFYSQGSCQGGSVQTMDKCVDGAFVGIKNFKSFSCTWDQTVDILGNVGCHDGVSTNVCVNDCNCVCNGQVLICPPKSFRCTPAAYLLCQDFCNCTTSCDGYNERTYAQNSDSDLITVIDSLLKLMTVRLAGVWW